MRMSVQRISQMRNLGPKIEQDLNAAGVFFPYQIIHLGPEQAFIKMLEGRVKMGRSAKCCNSLYLYAIYGAIHDIDWRKIPEIKKNEFKSFAMRIRLSKKFG